MFKRGVIALVITLAAIAGMLWYGGELIQSVVLEPPLPFWPMYALWAIASIAAVFTAAFCTAHVCTAHASGR